MVSQTKDSIGAVLSRREGLNGPDQLHLVGLKPREASEPVPAGAHLMASTGPVDTAYDQGYVTSSAFSPVLGHAIALAFLKGGAERMGETLRLVSPLTNVETLVEVTSPHFIDPEGDRQRA
jgi:sarcosine oxidase subunit alpha